MYTAPFEYHRAGSVDEALSLLERYGEEAKLVAGGHSLIPVMKLRFAQPAHLIDIRKVPGLSGIREGVDHVAIGALTTYRQIESSELIRQRVPVLAEAAGEVGDMQIRSMGTIGGSLAHADPAADLPAVILALGAEMRATGRGGARAIAADDFFVGLFTSALQPEEVLTEVRVPLAPPMTGGAYEKYPDPASGYAVVGVAAVLTLGADGVVQRARVAITGLGPKASRATAVEEALMGKAGTDGSIADVCGHAADELELSDGAGGSVAYRANLAATYARRAVTRAGERAMRG